MPSEPRGRGGQRPETEMSTDSTARRKGRWLDENGSGAKKARSVLRAVFPDHWSFLLGEIAVYSFVILLITGTLLAVWFQPSMTQVVYHGSYLPLRGVRMSQAYASTLKISFDVRGGLLLRQIHHWASDLFLAAIMAHMIRIFLHGGYRKPRQGNWLLGITLFTLAIAEGLFGNYLPGDLVSGTGVRVAEGILLSVPFVGTYLTFLLFGGPFPGHDITARLYLLHVLVIPAVMPALVAAHLLLTFWQKHTQMPGKGRTNQNVVGAPAYPHFMVRTGAVFFFTFAVLALLATFAQIDPVWLYGPYTPASASAGSGPEFYLGMLEGAIRVMPNWTWDIAGHTIAWNVFIPAVVVPGLFFTAAAAWPFAERWITGDRAEHNLADRPRAVPARTGIGMAVITFWGVLWAEGADDTIGHYLHIPFELITEITRYTVFIAPVLAYLVTKRVCLSLQRRDLDLLQHGVETGIVRQPDGGYLAQTRPVAEETRAVLDAQRIRTSLPPGEFTTSQDVPPPGMRSGLARVRERLNRVLTEGVPWAASSDGGHPGNGHPGRERVALNGPPGSGPGYCAAAGGPARPTPAEEPGAGSTAT
jgi:ubiquinol-cytochrome c reductase cytochrome b subunit